MFVAGTPMFFHEPELQYEVTVEEPDPQFAKELQQAIGGVEGEMRVALQYLFQAWATPAEHEEYRKLLMETATEELGHIEMLATAVTKNAASGNLAADMYANVMAESTGRLLATRLWERTDDPGMKDMLEYLIARDTMHQNQWLAALETLEDPVPVPASFQQEQENQEFNYAFMSTRRDPPEDPDLPWTQGDAPDGSGEFSFLDEQPGGGTASAPSPDPSVYDEPNRE